MKITYSPRKQARYEAKMSGDPDPVIEKPIPTKPKSIKKPKTRKKT